MRFNPLGIAIELVAPVLILLLVAGIASAQTPEMVALAQRVLQLRQQGQLAEAIRAGEQVLKLSEQHFGPNSANCFLRA